LRAVPCASPSPTPGATPSRTRRARACVRGERGRRG
jgi:hypothetical protein